MKRIILFFGFILILVGCGVVENSPITIDSNSSLKMDAPKNLVSEVDVSISSRWNLVKLNLQNVTSKNGYIDLQDYKKGAYFYIGCNTMGAPVMINIELKKISFNMDQVFSTRMGCLDRVEEDFKLGLSLVTSFGYLDNQLIFYDVAGKTIMVLEK